MLTSPSFSTIQYRNSFVHHENITNKIQATYILVTLPLQYHTGRYAIFPTVHQQVTEYQNAARNLTRPLQKTKQIRKKHTHTKVAYI